MSHRNYYSALHYPAPRKFQLVRIRLNSGGYESDGTYYGVGAPLYRASFEGTKAEQWQDDFVFELRASDRSDAKTRVCAKFPGATFYR